MNQLQRFVEFVEKNAESDTLVRTLYRHFTASLDNYAQSASLPETLIPDILRNWLVRMMASGLSKTTYSRYVRRLHTLHREFRRATTRDPFSSLQPLLELNQDAEITTIRKSYDILCNTSVGNPLAKDAEVDLPLACCLILLYIPMLSPEALVYLKRTDPLPDIPQIQDLKERMQETLSYSPQQQYLIPMGQGKQRTPRLISELTDRIKNHLPELDSELPLRELLTSVWIYAALNLRIDPSEILTLIPQLPAPYAYLGELKPASLTEESKNRILRNVADSFNPHARRWHILHLRSGVKSETLTELIATRCPNLSKETEYYYPIQIVSTLDLKKKKRVKREKPLLPKLLFIKIETRKVGKLIARIGQQAWCYRRTPSPTSPYTFIPNAEMQRFQTIVERLNAASANKQSGNKDSLDTTNEDAAFAEGEIVIIEGDPLLEGRIGEIRSVRHADGTRTYTLQLSTTAMATWTVTDIPEAFLLPLNKN